MSHPDLEKRGGIPVPEGGNEIRLFCVVQNEMLRLPYFMEYYRQLGVTRFIFVDNKSDDGTGDYLRAQPDVHLFHTDASFGAAKGGATWLNALLDDYGNGHWCVVADADELLVYPDCETMNLPELCSRMEKEGSDAVQTILLDMYGDKPMPILDYHPGQDLRRACAFFDSDYQFIRRLSLPGCPPPFPAYEPIGGPRTRMFFPLQHKAGLGRSLFIKMLNRLLKPLAGKGWIPKDWVPHPAPQMFKIPLVKWRPGLALVTKHRTTPLKLSAATGALLHFKYLNDFADRTITAIKHGQYYNGSSEYHRYGVLLRRNPNVTFMYPGSRRYESSEDLVRAGLIRRGLSLVCGAFMPLLLAV